MKMSYLNYPMVVHMAPAINSPMAPISAKTTIGELSLMGYDTRKFYDTISQMLFH